MKYNIDDIQIFVLTNKRKKFLKRMLESLLIQSIQISEIFIMDNDSNDDINNFIKKDTNIKIHHNKTIGKDGNYLKMLEIVNKEYMIVLHDDDILHPKYFEYVLKYLNQAKIAPVLLGCGYKLFKEDAEIKYTNEEFIKYLVCNNQKYFTNAIHLNYCSFCYPSAIFKTEFYKKIDNRILMNKYGKLADFFVLTNIASYGISVILLGNYYFKRIHKDSDSKNLTNLLNEKNLFNIISELSNLTDKFINFSLLRLYEIIKDIYQYTNLKEDYFDYFLYFFKINKNLISQDLNKLINSNLKYLIYRHFSILNYLKYLFIFKIKRVNYKFNNYKFIDTKDIIYI